MANQEKAAPPPKLRAAEEAAVKSIGSGFDMVMDCRLEYCKDPSRFQMSRTASGVAREIACYSAPEFSLSSRFIEKYGTHIITGVKVGGKDVLYVKQHQSSPLQVVDVQKILKDVAEKRFIDECGLSGNDNPKTLNEAMVVSLFYTLFSTFASIGVIYRGIWTSVQLDRIEYGLTFMDSSTLSIYSHREEITFMWRRRGGSNNKTMSHEKWFQSVKLEPEVISMTFIPISSFLSGINGKGFLSHAINLYQRYKPPIESLHQFLDFQTVKLWAPVHGELTLVHGREQQSNPCFQFSFLGPKLYVNTDLVDVGRKPVIGARLYLEGRISNSLAIHLQHLSDCPKTLQLLSESSNKSSTSLDQRYCEKVRWKIFDHVCTAPIESDHDLDIVTGAQFQVKKSGLQDVLFLLLKFSRVSSDVVLRKQEWDCFPDLAEKSGLVTSFLSSFVGLRQPPKDPDVNLNSAVYPDGPPVSAAVHELLRFVDTRETKRGPQDAPGFWVVSGARLLIEKGKISLSIKYSLFLHRFAC